MITSLGLNYSPEEVQVENSNNVFTKVEFRIKLPEGVGLLSMPKMSWTRVNFFLLIKIFFVLPPLPKK